MTGAGRVGFLDRLAARLAGLRRGSRRFVLLPEPGCIGLAERGRWLLAGSHLVDGRLVQAVTVPPWEVPGADAAVLAATHGFGWLDDLAGLGDRAARRQAQDWTLRWIARYGRGGGPGWVPALAARRLGRWLCHAALLTDGDERLSADLARAASRTVPFLVRRWTTAEGTARIEALAAILRAGLALDGMERHVTPAAVALGREAAAQVDGHGGIVSRSPEDLADLFVLLVETEAALVAAGRPVAEPHRAAIRRIAPVLRMLRHADGGLARFHGGGRAFPERVERALAAAMVRAVPADGAAMGFMRLADGRTSVIVDAADPPPGSHAHASTLAFEMTSGRRPVVVSCGSGRAWGAEWHRAGRATPSHSTLTLEGFSSSRLGRSGEAIADRARVLSAHRQRGPAGTQLHLIHAGWAETHGLTHRRDLVLAPDGRSLSGVDTLAALTAAERRRLDAVLKAARGAGVRYALRFHLHPDVDAAIEPGGTGVRLTLASGEHWTFRAEGPARLTLDPSVYLDRAHLLPRACRQIVLAGVLLDVEARIGWTFAKTEDTPLAIRDVERDDLPDRP
ncbi:heparinase II/III family protein [Cereibacter sphaeroides]|uniref:heparinase II/III family protein n=1 Tax=Cereibacter sphaeroides TaxID=1063 RepID=UPI001F24DB09|nr:heparinase II/III family protein [Cereibacter sphaeroides]MCE6958594.1 heparinase II/III family protein [Cereibacter sphaeroides]MCE6972363.1 heparinase II/III family protein [Cereibacter sphaeroides]